MPCTRCPPPTVCPGAHSQRSQGAHFLRSQGAHFLRKRRKWLNFKHFGQIRPLQFVMIQQTVSRFPTLIKCMYNVYNGNWSEIMERGVCWMLIYLCFYIFYYISTLYIYVNKFNNNFFQTVHNYCLFALKGEDVKSPFKSSQTEERGQPP